MNYTEFDRLHEKIKDLIVLDDPLNIPIIKENLKSQRAKYLRKRGLLSELK